MNRTLLAICAPAMLLAAHAAGPAEAQEKSVRPGINDPFKDPDLKEWVTRFEGESRETFDKRKEIVAACKLKPGMTVADVGAGTGLYTRLFATEVGEKGEVYANDISQKFLDHVAAQAKRLKLTNVKTVLGKDDSAGLPAGAVDVVFVCDTYHHFEFPQKMLASIHKALKPGGRLVVVDFIREEGVSSKWVLGHVRAGQVAVEKEIAAAGFTKSDEVKDLLKENYLVVFEKPAPGHTNETTDAVKKAVAVDKAVLLDVRERSEWDDGHLKDAKLLPLSVLKGGVTADEVAKIVPTDKVVYCHCGSGVRCLKAADELKKLGYDVRPLKPGYADLLKAGFAPALK